MKLKSLPLFYFIISVSFLTFSSSAWGQSKQEKKADKLHHSILTIDTHNDTPFRFTDPSYDMSVRHDAQKDGTKMDFPRMREGGLDAAFFAVFVGQGPRDEEGHAKAYARADRVFKSIHVAAERYSDIAEIATTPADAIRLEKEGKTAMFIGVENGYPVGNDLSKVEEFYNRGARYITLCHSSNNDICDSSTDRKGAEHNGLSAFGEEVVVKMNELGMMIDVSHASDESFFDIIESSKAPIIASHSSVKAISDSPRNLTDEMLKALATNGGVIQICILSSYIKQPAPNPVRDSAMNVLRAKFNTLAENDSVQRDILRKEWRMMGRKYPAALATVQDAVDHIDHVVQLIGIDHVGIGTDFDGGGGIEGCFDASEMGNITRELVARGYSKSDIQKIWSGNIIRVMNQVEKVSASINRP